MCRMKATLRLLLLRKTQRDKNSLALGEAGRVYYVTGVFFLRFSYCQHQSFLSVFSKVTGLSDGD